MIHTNQLKNEIDSKHLLPGTGSCINSETLKIPNKSAKENKKKQYIKFIFKKQQAVIDFDFQMPNVSKCYKKVKVSIIVLVKIKTYLLLGK